MFLLYEDYFYSHQFLDFTADNLILSSTSGPLLELIKGPQCKSIVLHKMSSRHLSLLSSHLRLCSHHCHALCLAQWSTSFCAESGLLVTF